MIENLIEGLRDQIGGQILDKTDVQSNQLLLLLRFQFLY